MTIYIESDDDNDDDDDAHAGGWGVTGRGVTLGR